MPASAILVLNRPSPISRGLGGAIGFIKEYKSDRKARKEMQDDSSSDDRQHDYEWAQAIDEAQQDSRLDKDTKDEKQSIDEFVMDFFKRYPPPPYHEQQPSGRLTQPVILPQRRPQSRTRGFVRAYAPILEGVDVSQEAWLEFLDGFEKSISENSYFWAANAANTYLDYFNDGFFKPRGLYCLILKYKPDDLNELSSLVDVKKNITETVAKRDDPERSKWKNILDAATDTTESDSEMPDFAPLVFPYFENADQRQQESAWKHFKRFRQEYADRQATAVFDAKNPDSKLAGAVPQQEWASRYSNPIHPARQGGTLAVLTGGKYNPKGPIQVLRDRRKETLESDNVQEHQMAFGDIDPEKDALAVPGEAQLESASSNMSSDGTYRNEIAWQASMKQRQGPMRRLLRQDVLYLMVVNMPSEAEMENFRRQLEAAGPRA